MKGEISTRREFGAGVGGCGCCSEEQWNIEFCLTHIVLRVKMAQSLETWLVERSAAEDPLGLLVSSGPVVGMQTFVWWRGGGGGGLQ